MMERGTEVVAARMVAVGAVAMVTTRGAVVNRTKQRRLLR
jgi:hypothetical protein